MGTGDALESDGTFSRDLVMAMSAGVSDEFCNECGSYDFSSHLDDWTSSHTARDTMAHTSFPLTFLTNGPAPISPTCCLEGRSHTGAQYAIFACDGLVGDCDGLSAIVAWQDIGIGPFLTVSELGCLNWESECALPRT